MLRFVGDHLRLLASFDMGNTQSFRQKQESGKNDLNLARNLIGTDGFTQTREGRAKPLFFFRKVVIETAGNQTLHRRFRSLD